MASARDWGQNRFQRRNEDKPRSATLLGMGNVGPLEVLVVLIIALVIFGPKRIPELGKSLGNGIRNFKSALDGEDDDDEPESGRIEPPRLPASGESPATVRAEHAEDAPTVQNRL